MASPNVEGVYPQPSDTHGGVSPETPSRLVPASSSPGAVRTSPWSGRDWTAPWMRDWRAPGRRSADSVTALASRSSAWWHSHDTGTISGGDVRSSGYVRGTSGWSRGCCSGRRGWEGWCRGRTDSSPPSGRTGRWRPSVVPSDAHQHLIWIV